MRIVFMGTPEFAVPSLQAVIDAGHIVTLVVSTPDRQKGRGLKLVTSAVKSFASENGLEVATPESLKEPGFLAQVAAAEPDLICVVAFRILPESLYSIPRYGSFNLHGSLLPKYRGAAPINWAIINGETETGVTTFFLQRRVDTGSIILQRSIPIGPEMTAGELHDLMMGVGAEVVVETVAKIERGDAIPLPQEDSAATPAPKIFRDDCLIIWNSPSIQVHNVIRGLSPYPGAFTHLRDKVVKIYRARPVDEHGMLPGEIRGSATELIVGTGDGAMQILELQQEGKRAMGSEEFLRGFRLVYGERFEDAETLG